MEKQPGLMDRNAQYHGDADVFQKVDYNSNQNFNWVFHGIDKLILKYLWKSKGSRIFKALLSRNKLETCLNLKVYS